MNRNTHLEKTSSYVWAIVASVFISGLVIFLYQEVLWGMGSDWNNNPDYSHGFLVPILSIYFVWERWNILTEEVPSPSIWGIGLLLLGLFSLVVGLDRRRALCPASFIDRCIVGTRAVDLRMEVFVATQPSYRISRIYDSFASDCGQYHCLSLATFRCSNCRILFVLFRHSCASRG